MAEAGVAGRARTCPGNGAAPRSPQKELAGSKHQYSIDELEHRENLIQARRDDELARQVELEKHKVLCWGGPAACLPLPRLQDAGHGSWA